MNAAYPVRIPPGKVRTIICEDVCGAVSALTEDSYDLESGRRTLVLEFPIVPRLEAMLDRVHVSLAEIGLSLWPEWYGCRKPIPGEGSDSINGEITLSLAINRLATQRQEISMAWLKTASRMCSRRIPPMVSEYPRAVSIRQLSLAIQPEDLLLAIVCEDDSPLPENLSGLARAAEWVAREAGAGVAVLISKDLPNCLELDPILYDTLLWEHGSPQETEGKNSQESKHVVWPIHGKPHPFSPGEQELARRLERDAELCGLFHFNRTVTALGGSLFLVDLVWPQGKIVVEVDGYKHHSNKFSFNEDRRRDYELLVSGYLVLRLPHEEVMSDRELALEKIRSVVRFRREQFSGPL